MLRNDSSMRLASLALAACITFASPARPASSAAAPQPPARLLPSPDELLTDIDPQTLTEIMTLAPTAEGSGPAMLARLDNMLAKHSEPSKLRGFLQFLRAGLLSELGRESEAAIGVEESVRLLPEYSAPLFQAVQIHTYSGKPGRAADFLLRAATQDPAATLKYPDYELMGLIRRLESLHQHRKAELVADRFLELGWSGTTLDAGSNLALRAIRLHTANGNVEKARSLVTRITVPAHGSSLLVDKQYEVLWPAVEQWGGTRLEKLWKIHLTEARSRFKANADYSTMVDYANALETANRSAELVERFSPLFADGKLDKSGDDLLFVIADLGQALVRQGKISTADEVFARARSAWPLGERANNLNVHANYGSHLLNTDRAVEGLKLYDEVLSAVRKHGDEVNADAIWVMRHFRACIMHEVGRSGEALMEAELLARSGATSAPSTFLCIDRPDRAKSILLQWLQIKDRRSRTIEFMQPTANLELPTIYGRRQFARSEKLRTDPDLRKAIEPFGRILPFSLSDGAAAVP